jgi:hypothetical protein
METNARIDYFRSEIEGKLEKLRKDFDERTKALEMRLTTVQQKLDSAVRELQRI